MSDTFNKLTNPLPWVSKLETKVETKINQNGEYRITPQNPSIECIGNVKLSVYVPNNVDSGYNTYLIKTGEGEEDQQVKKINEVKENEVVITTENGTKTLEFFNEEENKMTKKYTVITNVDQDTNVQPWKMVTITNNGETMIEPDEGYEAVSLVTASVNVPAPEPNLQEKEVTYTENGTSSITPDVGYDGLSKVTTIVNVPTSGGNLEEQLVDITIAGETVILPSEGYDGLSKVTVITHSEEGVTNTVEITPSITEASITIKTPGRLMKEARVEFNNPIAPIEYIDVNSIKARFISETSSKFFIVNPLNKISRDPSNAFSWDYTPSSNIPRSELVSGKTIPAVALNATQSEWTRTWGKISLLLLQLPFLDDVPKGDTFTLTYHDYYDDTEYCDLPLDVYLMTYNSGTYPDIDMEMKLCGFYDTHSYSSNFSHPFENCGMIGETFTIGDKLYIDGNNSLNKKQIGYFTFETSTSSGTINVYEYARIYGNFIAQ